MSYKRLIAIFCFLLSLTGSIWAQDDNRNAKIATVFNNLTYTKGDGKASVGSVLGTIADVLVGGQVTQQHSNYQEAVRANIVKGLSQARRIVLQDGSGMSQATWYVDATVSNISTTTKMEDYKDSKGKTYTRTYYKANVGVTLHVKNAQTNNIVSSPTFNISDYDCSWIETREGAINSALSSLARKITNYFNRTLPLQANIVEGAREKKDKQKEVYIDLGNTTKGICQGLHFGVYTTKTVAGKVAKKLVGKIKITEVQGEDLSLCKVQSGGKEIKAAIDAGEPILVTSLD